MLSMMNPQNVTENIFAALLFAVLGFFLHYIWNCRKKTDIWQAWKAKQTFKVVFSMKATYDKVNHRKLIETINGFKITEIKNECITHLKELLSRPSSKDHFCDLYNTIQRAFSEIDIHDSAANSEIVNHLIDTLYEKTQDSALLSYRHQFGKLGEKDDWIPVYLFESFKVNELDLIKKVREKLREAYKDNNRQKYYLGDTYAGRDIEWSDVLLEILSVYRMHQHFEPRYDIKWNPTFIIAVSLYLQFGAATLDGFKSWSDYSNLLDGFFEDENGPVAAWEDEAERKRIHQVCKAVWDANFLGDLIKDDPELAFCAAMIRMINVISPYNRVQSVNKSYSCLDQWYNNHKAKDISGTTEDEMKYVAQLVLSTLVNIGRKKEDAKGKKPAEEKIIVYSVVPEQYSYLVRAYEEVVLAEFRRIDQLVDEAKGHMHDTFKKFLAPFKEFKVHEFKNIDEAKNNIRTPEIHRIPGALILTDSGLRVLANVDLPTMSSSEFIERYVFGIKAVCDECGKDNGKIQNSIEHLGLVAEKLRPQLALIKRVSQTATEAIEGKKSSQGIAAQVTNYYETLKVKQAKAADNASKEVVKCINEYYTKGDNKRAACFLFGYGTPLWLTVKLLLENKENITFITVPLRPVGEGKEIKILKKVEEERLTLKYYDRFVLLPDELIFSVMNGKIGEFEVCCTLMGCEAYDSSSNFINSTGAALIAAVAREAKKPLYVITESDKEWDLKALESKIAPIAAERYGRGIRELEVKFGNRKLPVAEIISQKFEATIITEDGITHLTDTSNS